MLFTVFKKNLYLSNCKVIERLQIQGREFCVSSSVPFHLVWVRGVVFCVCVCAESFGCAGFLRLQAAGLLFVLA